MAVKSGRNQTELPEPAPATASARPPITAPQSQLGPEPSTKPSRSAVQARTTSAVSPETSESAAVRPGLPVITSTPTQKHVKHSNTTAAKETATISPLKKPAKITV
uniref:Uncharacterized protein n=1 Tax=Panagrolaimus sp. JU765 TaxID=591449 RepID=A0AC34QKX7_9BILA